MTHWQRLLGMWNPNGKLENSNHTVVLVKWKMCSAATVCFSPPHYILFPCFHYSKLWILSLEQSRETATCKAQDVVAAALRLDGHALQHANEATRDDVRVWFHLVPCKSFSNHVMILSHMCSMCKTYTHLQTHIYRERLICLSLVCHMQSRHVFLGE